VGQRGRGSSSEGSTSSTNRRPHFYEEKKLPEQYRSRNSHYRNTEYDRGHMAPAADFNFPHDNHNDNDNDNHNDRQQLIDTFNLCNTAPQLPGVNRKVWAALEDWTRRVARAAHEQAAHNKSGPTTTTLVLTGPLFLPAKKVAPKSDKDKQLYQYEYAAIGQPPALQSVPTHFFKVVVVVLDNTIQAFACFVVPNHESVADETDLTQFVVPWTALETVSGLEMFPALTFSETKDDWKASADAVTRAITQNQTPVLLLNDGIGTPKGGGDGKRKNQKHWTPLQHLCSKGQCQRPYSLLSSVSD
jgi:endonuclease G